jgi:hypothetical protein
MCPINVVVAVDSGQNTTVILGRSQEDCAMAGNLVPGLESLYGFRPSLLGGNFAYRMVLAKGLFSSCRHKYEAPQGLSATRLNPQ